MLNEGVPGQFFTSSGSHSLDMNALATYRLPANVSVDGVVGRVTWINIDEADQSHPDYWVYYTTNASGAWKTRLLAKANAVEAEVPLRAS